MSNTFWKWPTLWTNYAKPRFDKTKKKRWSEPNLIKFIQSKPHWGLYDFKNELRITKEHATYLILKANKPKIKAWAKDKITDGQLKRETSSLTRRCSQIGK